MKKTITLLSILIPVVMLAQTSGIIPKPVSYEQRNGDFLIDKYTTVFYNPKDLSIKPVADYFGSYVTKVSGLLLKTNTKKTNTIQFKIASIPEIGEEGYLLSVTPTTIVITANTKAGLIYGVQSVLQQFPGMRTNQPLTVPCMEVKDYPRFKWRGLHLDVSRHFFGPEFIKQYIDLIAAYKLNTFHWHLTDDQGWRIEIKKYPLLTQIGAWRVDKNDLLWGSRPQAKPDEAATYGGYYTQEQIKEIVKYASERNVTIVPEIDVPGHSAAAIASYPFLSCVQQKQLPMTGGNYTNMASNFCVGNDSVFQFVNNVLTELVSLFPSKYIHIGGDEVDKSAWKKCPKCQARMTKEHLKNEEELQSYFIKRVEKMVVGKGRRMIGWDEILEGGLAPEATVMSWRGESGGVEAAKMNHDVVMTPGTPLYFDHYQAGPEGEPIAFGGMNTLQNVYNYEPIPAGLPTDKAKYVLGAQANLWAESIISSNHVEYMVLPRMLALAEVVWSPKEAKNWNDFNDRVQRHFKVFDQMGLTYCKGNYTVHIIPEFKNGKLVALLSSEIKNAKIHYTIDGSEPTSQSTVYTEPIEIAQSQILKAAVTINGQIMGVQAAKQNFVMHKAIGAQVTYTNPVSPYYKAEGANTLVNGIRGNTSVGKYWLGFSAKDFIATVNMGKEATIESISLGCLQKYNDWIFLPRNVKFEISTDNVNFKEIAIVDNPVDINVSEKIYDFNAKLNTAVKAQYIRITAKNSLCPPGHSGAGKPGWIFVDEIIVQ